jgi:hypothetical protein
MAQFENFVKTLKDDHAFQDLNAFFQHLSSLGLTCSNSQFQDMVCEKEKPSQNLIDILLSISDTDAKDSLIKIYAELLFPQNYQATGPQGVRFLKQKVTVELTEFQVNEMAKSKIHYYLFLILVLKADKIKTTLLKKQFGNLETFDIVIKDLIESQVLIHHNKYIYSISPNVKFPAATSPKLKKIYEQFDEWDKNFSTAFSFEKLIEKTIIRRISERHLPLIQRQLENVLDTIRTSETSLMHRDQEPIVFLQLNFTKGK